jgi:hypothetical protein
MAWRRFVWKNESSRRERKKILQIGTLTLGVRVAIDARSSTLSRPSLADSLSRASLVAPAAILFELRPAEEPMSRPAIRLPFRLPAPVTDIWQ